MGPEPGDASAPARHSAFPLLRSFPARKGSRAGSGNGWRLLAPPRRPSWRPGGGAAQYGAEVLGCPCPDPAKPGAAPARVLLPAALGDRARPCRAARYRRAPGAGRVGAAGPRVGGRWAPLAPQRALGGPLAWAVRGRPLSPVPAPVPGLACGSGGERQAAAGPVGGTRWYRGALGGSAARSPAARAGAPRPDPVSAGPAPWSFPAGARPARPAGVSLPGGRQAGPRVGRAPGDWARPRGARGVPPVPRGRGAGRLGWSGPRREGRTRPPGERGAAGKGIRRAERPGPPGGGAASGNGAHGLPATSGPGLGPGSVFPAIVSKAVEPGG